MDALWNAKLGKFLYQGLDKMLSWGVGPRVLCNGLAGELISFKEPLATWGGAKVKEDCLIGLCHGFLHQNVVLQVAWTVLTAGLQDRCSR